VARVGFTSNVCNQTGAEPGEAGGATVGEVLAAVFERCPRLRGYLLDDQGAVRPHVVVFVDGEPIRDRAGLSDAVGEDAEVFIAQALSGG